MTDFVWTEDAVSTLKELWAERLTSEQCAERLYHKFGGYLSRSAVLGKVCRLGLPKRKPPPKPKPEPTRRRRRRLSGPVGQWQFIADADEVPTPADDLAIPEAQRKTLIQLGAHDCRWPVGDPGTPEFFFCAAETIAGQPYCRGHMQRAWRRA